MTEGKFLILALEIPVKTYFLTGQEVFMQNRLKWQGIFFIRSKLTPFQYRGTI